MVNQNGQQTYISGTVRDKAFDEGGKLKSITVGDTICYVNNSDIKIGSFVKLSGKVYPMESAMNRGGFDHKKYYASKRIRYRFNVDKVISIKPGKSSIRELYFKERNKLACLVNANCPYEAGTISTLLLGDKSNLSEDRKELFKDVGISHFLVISGLHISIIGSLIFRGLKKLGIKRSVSCFLSMLIIFNYGLLVGFSISVIRAVTMYFLRLLSYILKHSYDMLSAIFASVIV
ncbi:MAG: ComEC/Rec2 family competence protein, partial [Lachnospiraceae bacterium]|nr:ComEC/Rec2 family competence protein [Lachnospiraceae bacterium]